MLARLLQARLDERVHGLASVPGRPRARGCSTCRSSAAAAKSAGAITTWATTFTPPCSASGWSTAAATGGRPPTLDAAQEAKLDLVCRKLRLQPGMRVLDIGCGWGEALKFAAERYGVQGVGVTISAEQAAYARRLCAGLPVEIRLQDYRDVEPHAFDRVLSIGMFEHVGARNYATFFDVARRSLDPAAGHGGLFLLHSIGSNTSTRHTDPWIARYIFPNSMIPSAAQIAAALEGRFVVEDWHGFGPDYDRTLQAWRANIEAAWERLPARYDARFRRMWQFYLAASMASFRVRRNQLWQLLLSPRGVPGGLQEIR